MKTIQIDKYYKGFVAHRGLSGIETENTIFSFLAAANHSYIGVSCDLMISKDKQLILSHETSLLKFGLLNLDIESFDYEELIKFHLVDRKTENINPFVFIPKLMDYLSICKAYQKLAFIRFHNWLKPDYIDQAIEEISLYHSLDETVFLVKNKKHMDRLLKHVGASHIYFMFKQGNEQDYEFCNKHKVNAYLEKQVLTAEFVKKLHLIGLKAMTGVVNDKHEAEKLIKLDIDYIFTEILE